MAKRVERVTVYLFGGLGNQLFQYAAGLAVAEETGTELFLKPFGQTSAVGREGEVGIRAFKTLGTLVSSKVPDWLQEKLLRRFVTITDRFQLQGFFHRRGIFLADCPELSQMRLGKHRHIRLMGYFQDSKYADSLIRQEKGIQLELMNPSPWFESLQESARLSGAIILHIRRGDYLNHANTMGVLDFEYFYNALKLIPQDDDSVFWIFSDSINAAQHFAIFAKLPETRTRIISATAELPDAESLILMSLGSALVISNSTFSWWAGYLNKKSQLVVAPTKWFKNLEDPQNLLPSNWVRCESIWLP